MTDMTSALDSAIHKLGVSYETHRRGMNLPVITLTPAECEAVLRELGWLPPHAPHLQEAEA